MTKSNDETLEAACEEIEVMELLLQKLEKQRSWRQRDIIVHNREVNFDTVERLRRTNGLLRQALYSTEEIISC